jgi:hypothetical protein
VHSCDLVRCVRAQVRGLRQVLPAPARAPRDVRDRVVGVVVPCQIRPGSAGCLPGRRFPPAFLACSSGMRPGRSAAGHGNLVQPGCPATDSKHRALRRT